MKYESKVSRNVMFLGINSSAQTSLHPLANIKFFVTNLLGLRFPLSFLETPKVDSGIFRSSSLNVKLSAIRKRVRRLHGNKLLI